MGSLELLDLLDSKFDGARCWSSFLRVLLCVGDDRSLLLLHPGEKSSSSGKPYWQFLKPTAKVAAASMNVYVYAEGKRSGVVNG